ncbi:MAG: AI-2E family transporter [Bacteroidales bacterium]|nr:AI-2E family transporter [Bacteroidales bacterium]MBR4272435.1 AI-2E family transporter [Bacteroidales bacterium]
MQTGNEQISPTVSLLLKICAVVGVLLLVYYLRNVLLPFAVAFMLAYILNPVVNFLQRYLRRRWIAVIVTLLFTFILLSAIFVIIVPLLFAEMRHLYALLVEHNVMTELSNGLPSFLADYLNKISNSEKLAAIFASDNIAAMIDSLSKVLLPHLGSFFSKTYSVIASTLGAAIIILYLIFIMLDYDGISKGIVELVPEKFKERFLRFFTRFTSEMQKYFRGQLLIVLCVMVLYSIGFTVIGLPMGLLLGLMVGMLNIVPYLQILGFLPALLLSFVMSMETGTPVWLCILMTASVFVTVQIIQDMFLTPKIMGHATGLNPAMILLSLSVWGKLLGFLGLIVAIPFTCIVKIYYSEYKTLYEKHDAEKHNAEKLKNAQQ